MYFRFIQTKQLLCHFQVTLPRIPLLPQIQLMPPPGEVAMPCSQQPVSLWSRSLFYISTVRDSGQGTSLLPHLLNPTQMASRSSMWQGRNSSASTQLILHLILLTQKMLNSKFDWFEGHVKGLTDDECPYWICWSFLYKMKGCNAQNWDMISSNVA
jgi:hypothetical protein